ncbi:MAG: FHA domain-containing protein, partial [Planctomycetota bacterium]
MATSSADEMLATIVVDTRASDYYLEVIQPKEPVMQQSLLLDSLTVGRGDGCDLKLNQQTVSREHGRIERVADRFRIRNLSSSNPIRVDGKNVDEAWLRPGSRVSLGDVVLVFRSVHESEAQPGFVTTFRNGWKALREGASLVAERSSLTKHIAELERRLELSDEQVGRAILSADEAASPQSAVHARGQILAERNVLSELTAEADQLRAELEEARSRVEHARSESKPSV